MNWEPFYVAQTGKKPDAIRPLNTFDGMGDRLRCAAFAEIQAREAFLWAASHFRDTSEELKRAWTTLAHAEQRHLDWLLARMTTLKIDVKARCVSDQLWVSLISCTSAREFALYMASAEERGRKAGIRFHEALRSTDSITADIFGKIAEEEISHIALAHRYFPAGV